MASHERKTADGRSSDLNCERIDNRHLGDGAGECIGKRAGVPTALKRELHGIGVEFGAVVEGDAGTQVECVGEAVVGDRPAFGQATFQGAEVGGAQATSVSKMLTIISLPMGKARLVPGSRLAGSESTATTSVLSMGIFDRWVRHRRVGAVARYRRRHAASGDGKQAQDQYGESMLKICDVVP
ncbi:MAG: hypothetical protein R2873_35660 [Caldilineaceae bacterium]